MRTLAFVKPVPDIENISVSRAQGRVFERGERALNPGDLHAVEAAVSLKGSDAATAFLLGDASDGKLLKRVAAMGVDEVVLLADDTFAGLDAGNRARVLAAAVRKALGDGTGALFFGVGSREGGSAQTGPRVAEILDAAFFPAVKEMTVTEGGLALQSACPRCAGQPARTLPLPAVVTVSPEANRPRTPNAPALVKAAKKEILRWGAADLGLREDEVGWSTNRAEVARTYLP